MQFGPNHERSVIRLRVADALARRGWTAYRLAQEAEITIPVAYRLAKADAKLRRLDLGTLDAVCRALAVQPGDLLEYVPDRRRGRS